MSAPTEAEMLAWERTCYTHNDEWGHAGLEGLADLAEVAIPRLTARVRELEREVTLLSMRVAVTEDALDKIPE